MSKPKVTPAQALDMEFFASDIDETLTFRDYMTDLLLKLFEEDEGFSGKRPFGNSGWLYGLYQGLVMIGAIDGEIEGDEVLDLDEGVAYKFLCSMVNELARPAP